MAGKSFGEFSGRKYFDVSLSWNEKIKFADWVNFMKNQLTAASSIEILRINTHELSTDIEFELRIWEKD